MLLRLLSLQNDLYLSAKLAHWNVKGPNFYSQHLLFQRIYETVGKSIDGLAELARGRNYLLTADIFRTVTDLDSNLILHLRNLSLDFYSLLSEAYMEAEKSHDHALSNFLQGMITDLDTIVYLLNSSL